MDLNSKIAARRAELARQQQQAKAEVDAAEARRKAAELRQREVALDDVADDFKADGIDVSRDGSRLVMDAPLPPIDLGELKREQAIGLIRSQARRMWTPRENLLVIGGLASGLTVVVLGLLCAVAIPVGGIAILCVPLASIYSWRRMAQLKRHYLEEAQCIYPALAAAAFGGAMPIHDSDAPPIGKAESADPDAPRPSFWQKLWWNPHAAPRK